MLLGVLPDSNNLYYDVTVQKVTDKIQKKAWESVFCYLSYTSGLRIATQEDKQRRSPRLVPHSEKYDTP